MYKHTSKAFHFLYIILVIGLLAGCGDREQMSLELVKKGRKKLTMGKNDEAMEYFSKAIRKDKRNFEAWFYQGSCKVSMQRYEESLADFDRALELKPDYAAAWFNRGLVFFYLNDQDKACADWREAEALGYPNISDRTRHCP